MAERRDVTEYGPIFEGGLMTDPPYASTKRRTLLGDGTLRAYADDGVTVLREERIDMGGPTLTPIGEMVLPFARETAARASTPANPQPAALQVWLPRSGDYTPGQLDDDGTLTIDAVENADSGLAARPSAVVRFRPVGGVGCPGRIGYTALTDPANGWRCIGVATERGRVMVGDGFHADGDPDLTTLTVRSIEHFRHVRMSDGYETTAESVSLWDRTRYAPARVGERYLHRSRKYMVTIPATPSILCFGNAMMGDEVRVHLCVGVSMPVAEWERLDPSTTSHAVAPVPRTDEATRAFMRLYEDRERIIADASLPTATGAGLDGLASAVFGIERRKPMASAYRGTTEAESDESLRARCMAKLGAPHPHAGAVSDMGDGVSAVRARETDDGRIAVSGRSGTSLNFTIEATVSTKGFEGAALAFTRIHDAIPKPAPAGPARARRDEVRRAIDSAIAADKGQPFAHARAAALHAWAETLYSGDTVADVAAVHAGLLRYEACRGSRREPSLAALDVGVPETARAMYERERAAVRVEAVTPRDEPARLTGGASLNGWQTAAHFWERWSQ